MLYYKPTDYCPSCNHWGYKCEPGEYAGDGQKLSPDVFTCLVCGFTYEEHVKTSEREEAKKYNRRKVRLKKKRSTR